MQVAADGMAAVRLAEHLAQPLSLAQPSGGTEHAADRDCAAEHRDGGMAHRVVGRPTRSSHQDEDLPPVGLPGARRDASALGDRAGVPQPAVRPVERDDAPL